MGEAPATSIDHTTQPARRRTDGTFKLTPELVAQYGGGPVVCLDARAIGRRYRLHAQRPGLETNHRLERRDEVIGADGLGLDVVPADAPQPTCTVVTIRGPLEQRAGYHDVCVGWSDGHDAIAERMCMALAEGDVVMVIDSPGGAHAGLQEAIRRVLEVKAQFGRHVCAYADEMIGSAAYWWAAAVADEIFLPEAGVVGSIGARAAHCSIAGHLAQEGIEPTYFAWPGPGKVAFAPELPLSDLGRERGERDVSIAGEAFAAAVIAARGIARDDIVELDADALTGQAAVDAGLADGVASLEDVLNYALDRSANGVDMAADETEDPKARASESYERTTKERYEREDDDDDDGDEPDGDEPKGDEEEDRRADEEEDEEDDDEEEDDRRAAASRADDPEPPAAPPTKKKPGAPAGHPPPPQRMSRGARAARAPRSLAEVFGLRAGSSMPAIMSAAVRAQRVLEHAAKLTGQREPGAIVGGLNAMAEDAADRARAIAEAKKLRARDARRQPMELLRKLAAGEVHTRGELFVDVVDETTGKMTIKPNPKNPIAVAPLSTLRGYVDAKLKNTAGVRRSPFEPDPKRAKSASAEAKVERVLETPFIQKIAMRSSASPEQLARTAAALEALQGVH